MILSLCHELEEQNIYSRTIGIRIRYTGFITRTKSVTLMQPTREVRVIECAMTGFCEMGIGPGPADWSEFSGLIHPDPVQRSLSDF